MAKNSVKDIRDGQRNIARMELAKTTSDMPGSVAKQSSDVKYKIGNDLKYGNGRDVTEEQLKNRKIQITEMILLAYLKHELMSYMRNVFGLSGSSADVFYRECKKSLADGWRENFEDEVDWHVAVRKRVVRNSIENKDDKMTLLALDSMAKVQKLYDIMPVLDPTDTEFKAGAEGLSEHDDIIKDIQNGNTESLEKFKKEYKDKDKRGLEFEEKEFEEDEYEPDKDE